MSVSFISKLYDIIFPSSCYLCNQEGTPLCQKCVASFDKPYTQTHSWIYSSYSFKDKRVRKLLHAIKFFHRKDLIRSLTEDIVRTISLSKEEVTIIPIPMHPFRRLLRGYNSTTYIAQIISEQTSAPVEHTLLTKTKITPRQVKTKNRSERLSNNKGTFAVTKKNIQGSYILIDDVTTTGSTLEEARNILLKHGAMSVIAMTIAH